LLGVVLGAVAGVLLAPARGEVTRRRIGRRVGDLKDLAAEKLEALGPGDDDDDTAGAEEPSTRQELERRLREARRRRRVERAARDRQATLEEDDEPVA
jgi:gas vesicle protein